MTQKVLNNWIMYHEIHKLRRYGFSGSAIAQYLRMDARTVRKYLEMNEQEYEQFLIHSSQRTKILDAYENFVRDKLSLFKDTSTAQIHDWLKEHHPDFPLVSTRTVYNFVMFVRQRHNIPYEPQYRDYFPVEELPYGEQAQVDFGEYNMLLSNGKRKKVRFFAMVLSRSRMKYIWFLDKPFTANTVVKAHENAFEFFRGIPRTMVYDQDRTMIVDENIGDVILTETFRQYTKTRSFKLHFCRKADPESKGKIENVIQYVKKNFLYNRTYSDLENLNIEAIAWLHRTANSLPHNATKKSPQSEYLMEMEHLNPFTPMLFENNEHKLYHVRKNNVICFRSNTYSLPEGTYKGSETQVIVKADQGQLCISNLKNEPICTHQLSMQKGQTIINTNHRRDKSKSLDEMILLITSHFTNQSLALNYINEIRKRSPRYTRDHLQAILKTLTFNETQTADNTLEFCLKNTIHNGNEWTEIFFVLLKDKILQEHPISIKLLDNTNLEKANEMPLTSDIEDYEKIINQ